jgi:predicted nucleotidyltransferase component of viral defense system
MIRQGELQQKAREAKVRDQQIEKDYILSWILWGVSQHEELSTAIVFKGGTVLKKVYFDNYRFSEDLDFTLVNSTVTDSQIFAWFEESFALVRDETNIPLAIIDNNEHEDGGINFYVSYVGPLGGQGANKKVKVDISRSEQLQFNPVTLPVYINYSDQDDHKLLCYPLEEILVEKLRSVMQRMQARDFYDIWYLLEHHEMEIPYLLNEFSAKCSSKGLKSSDFPKRLSERLPQYKSRWASSMNEQIHNLPDFDQVVREVSRHLKKVNF